MSQQTPASGQATQRLALLTLPDASLSNIGLAWDLCCLPLMQQQAWLKVQPLHLPVTGAGTESDSCKLPASVPIERGQRFDTIIVIASIWQSYDLDKDTIAWLKQQYQAGAYLLLIGQQSEALLSCDCFAGKQVACHWSQLENMQQQNQSVVWTAQLFRADERLFTCPGGGATVDLVMAWLSHLGQGDLSAELAEWLLLERMRSHDVMQRVPLQTRLGSSQPKLTEAVTLMEANLEEPLSADDLANLVGLSRRHLERLFKKYLDQVPSKFYLQLRLDKARSLLRDTDLSIVEVSMVSGFSSASHFSTTYRSHFGLTPRQERGRSTSVEVGNNLPNIVAMQARLD